MTTETIAPATPKKMTYEEFLSCWDGPHAEWVNGEIIEMGTVSDEHSDLGGWLITLLRLFIRFFNLGVLRAEPFQMKTGPNLPGRSPDILFISNESMSRIRKNHLEGPADLVIEIISPESVARDRKEKFAEYERGGVSEYWLFDPIRNQADFYQRDENGVYQFVLPDENGIYRSKVLPGLRLNVNWLWERPLPSEFDILRAWNLIP